MNNFQVSTIRFSNIEEKYNKYDIINILCDDNQKIYLKLPKLECNQGITKYYNKFSINLHIDKTIHYKYYNLLENITDWIDDNFFENKQWLDKLNININSSKNDIKQCRNSIICKHKFKHFINMKLIYDNNGIFLCNIFKNTNGIITKINSIYDIEQLLYKKFYISSDIIISNIWIINGKYGITIKPKKIFFYDN